MIPLLIKPFKDKILPSSTKNASVDLIIKIMVITIKLDDEFNYASNDLASMICKLDVLN